MADLAKVPFNRIFLSEFDKESGKALLEAAAQEAYKLYQTPGVEYVDYQTLAVPEQERLRSDAKKLLTAYFTSLNANYRD